MERGFDKTLNALEGQINELEKGGISVGPLNHLVEELKQQVEDIHAIEDKIGSIQRVVMEPIKEELEQNKVASRFSKYGFYFGAIGFIVTLLSLAFNIDFSSHSPQPFSLGSKIEVTQDTSIVIEGIIECGHYWVCFVDNDNNVWPQVDVPPSELSGQIFNTLVDVPLGFKGGTLVLACVSNDIHRDYGIRAGGTAPMKKPPESSRFQVLLQSTVTVK